MEYLSRKVVDLYIKRNIIDPAHKEIYRCGVELILNEAFTFILVFIISAVFFSFRYSVEFLSAFCVTRIYCGGYHAKKTYMCRSTMIVTFTSVAVLSYYMRNVPLYIPCALLILSFAVLIPLVPVKHPNKNLTGEQIVKNRKKGICTYIVFAVIGIAVFVFADKRDGMVVCLSLCAVTVLAAVGTITNVRR